MVQEVSEGLRVLQIEEFAGRAQEEKGSGYGYEGKVHVYILHFL